MYWLIRREDLAAGALDEAVMVWSSGRRPGGLADHLVPQADGTRTRRAAVVRGWVISSLVAEAGVTAHDLIGHSMGGSSPARGRRTPHGGIGAVALGVDQVLPVRRPGSAVVPAGALTASRWRSVSWLTGVTKDNERTALTLLSGMTAAAPPKLR